MNRILAVSDIHGCFDEFQELLRKAQYDSAEDTLILLGDYMDRGEKSREVIYFVKELVEEHGAIALKGNHDKMLCDWLHNPIDLMDRYKRNGGMETLKSFLGEVDEESEEEADYEKWANRLLESHQEIVSFIENLSYFYENGQHVFVHAGINPVLDDWKETSEHELIWIREPFLEHSHAYEEIFVHGHTPSIYLHEHADIYYGNRKIGIDGGCVYGHQLNCLAIENAEYVQYAVARKVLITD